MKESWSTLSVGAGVILLAALVSGGLQAWRSELRLTDLLAVPPGVQAAQSAGLAVMDTAAVREAAARGSHLLLDARPVADYDRGHLPGALSLPQQTFETAFADLVPLLTPADPLIVYCGGVDCDDAVRVAERLREAGFGQVSVYAAGWEGWTDE